MVLEFLKTLAQSVHGYFIVNPAFALLLAALRSTQERVSEAMFSNPKGHFHGLNGSRSRTGSFFGLDFEA